MILKNPLGVQLIDFIGLVKKNKHYFCELNYSRDINKIVQISQLLIGICNRFNGF